MNSFVNNIQILTNFFYWFYFFWPLIIVIYYFWKNISVLEKKYIFILCNILINYLFFAIGLFILTVMLWRLGEYLLTYSTIPGLITGIAWATIIYLFVLASHVYLTQWQIKKWML